MIYLECFSWDPLRIQKGTNAYIWIKYACNCYHREWDSMLYIAMEHPSGYSYHWQFTQLAKYWVPPECFASVVNSASSVQGHSLSGWNLNDILDWLQEYLQCMPRVCKDVLRKFETSKDTFVIISKPNVLTKVYWNWITFKENHYSWSTCSLRYLRVLNLSMSLCWKYYKSHADWGK